MNLFSMLNDAVLPTSMTRKITLNNVTKIYPVYKVKLDKLYYNDQNDRIASYVTQYKSDYGEDVFNKLDINEYNDIIESFIVSSNPASIDKTQTNISLVGQREPAVVLKDGRVIDGNRRFTCLRRINKEKSSECWIETVILDMDIDDNKKIIKMLELSIQHGEEKKVDYNNVELLIGVYHDIVETGLLTIDDYAYCSNESVAVIRKRVESSKILVEFLEYIGMPKQFHVAREYQLVSFINDLQEMLKRCQSKEEADKLKEVAFINIMMDTVGDSRKYVKNIQTMLNNSTFDDYCDEQFELKEKIDLRRKLQKPETFSELKSFVRMNDDITEDIKNSMEKCLNGARRSELKQKPKKIVSKSISNLRDIDLNIIKKLDEDEIESLSKETNRLRKMADKIDEVAGVDKPTIFNYDEKEEKKVKKKETNLPLIKPSPINLYPIFNSSNTLITNLINVVSIKSNDLDNHNYSIYFVDKDYNVCSDIKETKLTQDFQELTFVLNDSMSNEKECYLIFRYNDDPNNAIRYIFEFNISIAFTADFGF